MSWPESQRLTTVKLLRSLSWRFDIWIYGFELGDELLLSDRRNKEWNDALEDGAVGERDGQALHNRGGGCGCDGVCGFDALYLFDGICAGNEHSVYHQIATVDAVIDSFESQ